MQNQSEEKSSNIQISVTGIISKIPAQHLIQVHSEYPVIDYFDSIEHGEIVVYSKKRIPTQKKLKLLGKWIEIKGTSKKPGSQDAYIEKSFLVDCWEEL